MFDRALPSQELASRPSSNRLDPRDLQDRLHDRFLNHLLMLGYPTALEPATEAADTDPPTDDATLQLEQFNAAVVYTDNFREFMQQRSMTVSLDAEQRPVTTTPLLLDLSSRPFKSDSAVGDLESASTLENLRRQHLIDEPGLSRARVATTVLPSMLNTYASIAQLHTEQGLLTGPSAA